MGFHEILRLGDFMENKNNNNKKKTGNNDSFKHKNKNNDFRSRSFNSCLGTEQSVKNNGLH